MYEETQKERMLAGKLYYSPDRALALERQLCLERSWRFNGCNPADVQKQQRLMRELLPGLGQHSWVHAPFRCDYGTHIHTGKNFFCNYNGVMLDCAAITIGDNVMFAPNVSLYTAGHPLDAQQRNSGWEYGRPIVIGSNVWLGGNVVVNPGVTIGDNVVVGSGSVVTRDIPADSLAVGNPARVLRRITDADREFYFKGCPYETGGRVSL